MGRTGTTIDVVTGSGLRGNRKTRGVGSGEYRLRRQPTLHLSRAEFETFSFAEVHALSDLRAGMVLPGIVTNVTAFGAFVDIGVHQDGLAHISELADRFVKDPNEVVRVRQQVEVRVLQVDSERKRIGLSMKKG